MSDIGAKIRGFSSEYLEGLFMREANTRSTHMFGFGAKII